jgi:hypothetical protein
MRVDESVPYNQRIVSFGPWTRDLKETAENRVYLETEGKTKRCIGP